MEEYHAVWLADHPNRTEDWLRQRLAEGFDIHHLDCDHSNNAPSNLVLIEHVDHLRLHGNNVKLGRLSPKTGKRVRRKGRRALERAKRNLAALDSMLQVLAGGG